MKLELIHYGASKYDSSKMKPIKNNNWIKPIGGLWASPINSKWGWVDWCKLENYGDITKSFTFWYEGNLLIIDSLDDLKTKVHFVNKQEYKYYARIDFEKLSKKYDAMFLTENGQRETRYSHPESLYGWDCESILIFNSNGIII